MMKKRCLWYFRGYIKDHKHVRKLIQSCKLFVFSSPPALFFSFSLLSVALFFRTLASLRFLKYVSCAVRFILGLGTTPLPFTNTARLWKGSSLWWVLSILLACVFFFSSPLSVVSEADGVVKIHQSACKWQKLLLYPAQHPPESLWPEPHQLTSAPPNRK